MGTHDPRIAFLGAGSIQFAPSLIVDLVVQRDLHGCTLVMVDTDADRLTVTHALGQRLLAAGGADITLEATTNRGEALAGADAVLISIELDRFATWALDRRLPNEHGVPQALGENGGPGGLLHGLRQIPPIVEICRDVERLCRNALVVNLANPLSRICQAIADETSVRWVGLCHEIAGGNRYLSRVLETPESELDVVAAGINHFTWYLQVRRRDTGEDLYPALRRAAVGNVTDDRLLTADLLRLTGWQCVTNDSHAGEYLAGGHLWRSRWAPDIAPLDFYAWYRQHIDDREAEIRAVADARRPAGVLLDRPSGEVAVSLIADVLARRKARYDAVNVANHGLISNLPEGCVVEVPGVVHGGEVRGVAVGELPPLIAEWCRRQVAIHRLTVRAALDGDRRAALEAMLLDPVVPDPQTAENVLDAMLAANRAYLPRFFG